jgi:3-hydroxyisobutyrate dehydrogenase
MRLGFVGLGTMGAPMAGHLLRAGHSVSVWNRTAEKAEPLREQGASVAADLRDLGELCDLVFICVNRSEDVRECLGGLTEKARPDTLFVDHSTISPKVAKEIHEELRGKSLRFIDAPITGGSMGAQKGQLTIFCGGGAGDIEDAMPYLDAYARKAERVGGPGAGQMMKMANQIAVAGSLLGLCEALSFAKKAGLDLKQTHALVGSGAAGSWAFENYGPKILAEDWSPGFSVRNQRKDFSYCFEAGDEVNAVLPGTQIVDQLLELLEEEGGGEWTTAALYKVLLEMESAE